MRKITLTFPYYNNAEMFKFQWNHIRSYPPDIRDHLEVIVVDDGSMESPMRLPHNGDFKCRFFRTLVDVPWNNPFVRNLSVKMAANEWIILTDIDHVFPENVMRHLMTSDFDPEKIYTFGRTYVKSLVPFELGDSRPRGHLYTFFLTKRTYEAVGGDDERLSGYYAAMETDFRQRAADRLTNLDDYRLQTVTYNLIHDARTHNLPRKEAPDHLSRRAQADEFVRRRNAGELPFLRLTHPYCELYRGFGKSPATPNNTAVVTIMAYENESQIPVTCGFMLESARKVGISVIPMLKGQKYIFNQKEIDMSFINKTLRLWKEIEKLPEYVKYILYADARDCLFVRPLADICNAFNGIGWPIVIGATRRCAHHVDPGWTDRFGKHGSGFNYLNAGMWMAERSALANAVEKLKQLSPLVRDDKIHSSFPPLHENDQHLWQTAYVEKSFPIRIDHDQKLFNNFHNLEVDEYDFEKSSCSTPVVLKNGSEPCIIHFAGQAGRAMPFFAWTMNIVKPPTIPPKSFE